MAIIDNYNAQGPGDAAGKRFDAPKPFYDAWQSKEGIPIH